jgi:hypothetical protein
MRTCGPGAGKKRAPEGQWIYLDKLILEAGRISRLIDEFDIDQESAEIFACGWFAGKYAGVSEVFNVVQREIDEMEKENKHPPPDGYA